MLTRVGLGYLGWGAAVFAVISLVIVIGLNRAIAAKKAAVVVNESK